MIEIDDKTYVLAMYFVGAKGQDWMGCITRPVDGTEWSFKYRHRYYDSPNDPWDGKDRKSWYHMKLTGDEEAILSRAGLIARIIALAIPGGPGELSEIIVKGVGWDALVPKIKDQEWFHGKVATQEGTA